jgi:hypothetical protein
MAPLKLPQELQVNCFPWEVGSGFSAVDTRFFPLSIVKHFGSDPDETVVRRYYSWRSHASRFAHSKGLPHITIMDFEEWGVPKPTIRKVISDYSAKDNEEVGFAWQYLIVTKPIMRGAITAIVWLRGDTGMYTWSSSYQDAIMKALAEFERCGTPAPAIEAAKYEFPAVTEKNRVEYNSIEYAR